MKKKARKKRQPNEIRNRKTKAQANNCLLECLKKYSDLIGTLLSATQMKPALCTATADFAVEIRIIVAYFNSVTIIWALCIWLIAIKIAWIHSMKICIVFIRSTSRHSCKTLPQEQCALNSDWIVRSLQLPWETIRKMFMSTCKQFAVDCWLLK